jgi:hypothetical protein
MWTSWNLPGSKSFRRISAALVLGCALLSGCASAQVTAVSEHAVQPAGQPDTIYVSAFDVDANDVKLDHGGALKKIKASMDGTTDAQSQAETAADSRDQLADAIVDALRDQGLRAERHDGPAPAGHNALIVQGRFDTIDEGNRRRRVLIGLGAGKSEVGVAVELVYQSANGATQVARRFDASADSGHAPGLAETAGVGAVAGQVATAAVAGTGLHGTSEARRGTVSAQTKRLAEAIAKQVAATNASHGWGGANS